MKKAASVSIILFLLVSGCGDGSTTSSVSGSIKLPSISDHGNVPVWLTSSTRYYQTVTSSDGSYTFLNVASGAYLLQVGEFRCVGPGPSDHGVYAPFYSPDPSVVVTNEDVTIEKITLHPGGCTNLTFGDGSSGNTILPGFNFDTRELTDQPIEADLFIELDALGLSCSESIITISTNGDNLLLIEPDPELGFPLDFMNLREVPGAGFMPSFGLEFVPIPNMSNTLFVIRTLTGNYVKVANLGGFFCNPAANEIFLANITLLWQLQPDGLSTFDY